MKTYHFTIQGNHKSRVGNAVPKLKMTGKQHWTPKAREYVQWKEHVVYSFLDSIKGNVIDQRMFASNCARHGKPFILGLTDPALMVLKIYWSNKGHGDPENIFGSIADALFLNDKNLDCVSMAEMSEEIVLGKKNGKVDAVIRLFEDQSERKSFLETNIK